MNVTILYEDLPFSDRKWLRTTKTDDGRIISRMRRHTRRLDVGLTTKNIKRGRTISMNKLIAPEVGS